jgi:ribose transport system permease protein
MKRVGALARSPLAVVVILIVILVVVNLVLTPNMFASGRLTGIANLLVPSILAAMASVPSILSGGGGLDLSIGPLLGFVNVFLVGVLLASGLGSGLIAIPLCLLLGAAVGAINGVLVGYLRLQPVVVTLGSYLALAGLSLVVLPQPLGGAPVWTVPLGDSILGGYLPLSLLLVVAALLIWWIAKKTGLVKLISAVGSDDRAAHVSGVDIRLVRVAAYTLGGLLAGLAGIALTVLINSSDPRAGIQYTLMAIVAVALGGNALRGGRGGMRGPILGAICLYLIQSLLSAANVSSLWIQVVYGAVLLAAVCLNSSIAMRAVRRSAAGASTAEELTSGALT